MTNVVLETRDLTKVYGRRKVVDAVNITAFAGEVFGFLGPNGAGKTTTLGMALGLVHATAGEVCIFGERVAPDRVHALREVRAVGRAGCVPYLSAWDNLELVGRLTTGINRRRISEVLELMGLMEEAHRKAARGEAVLDPRVASRILQELQGIRQNDVNPFTELSDREFEVLRLIAGANSMPRSPRGS